MVYCRGIYGNKRKTLYLVPILPLLFQELWGTVQASATRTYRLMVLDLILPWLSAPH
jgi:hypothetical protein